MLHIRTADKNDYIKVRDFYYTLIDNFKDEEIKPGWKKDIYPTQEFLIESIENSELYIGENDEQIIACMVVNHKYNDSYKKIKWSVEAADEELLVIHALGVNHAFWGKGIAKLMVQRVIELAVENGIKTIRLDVLEGNIPAEKTYAKMGFEYLDTIQMFYEDTGWTNFKAFEFIV